MNQPCRRKKLQSLGSKIPVFHLLLCNFIPQDFCFFKKELSASSWLKHSLPKPFPMVAQVLVCNTIVGHQVVVEIWASFPTEQVHPEVIKEKSPWDVPGSSHALWNPLLPQLMWVTLLWATIRCSLPPMHYGDCLLAHQIPPFRLEIPWGRAPVFLVYPLTFLSLRLLLRCCLNICGMGFLNWMQVQKR